ncbi:hypothetical protein DFH27DRAFT_571934 [Peziza echinospora]|nr:hypothetical protein DFH27DRAFT_571934 [Peziza echinospora]
MASAATHTQTAVAMIGATGLTGRYILNTLLAHPDANPVFSLTRRAFPAPEPADPSSKLQVSITPDTAQWPSALTTLLQSTPPSSRKAFLSALGSTRADAGSVEALRKIDIDINLAAARAAKEANVHTYVLISSAYADATSRMFYVRMKGELEDEILKLGFERTVFVKPGLIVGGREKPRAAEAVGRLFARGLKSVAGGWAVDGWAQEGETIGRAAARAAVEDAVWEEAKGSWEEREGGKRVWNMRSADIVRFGEVKGEKK